MALCGAPASLASVEVASTGNDSELVRTVPITTPARAKPTVVMSLGGDRLPQLARHDVLRASAELEVTTDCLERVRGCQGDPYQFDPEVRARLILARDAKATEGVELGQQRITCHQLRPNREHHCVIVFDFARHAVDADHPPQHVNLVVEAFDDAAGSDHKLIIGAASADESHVEHDKGRISVVRLRGGHVTRIPRRSHDPGPPASRSRTMSAIRSDAWCMRWSFLTA